MLSLESCSISIGTASNGCSESDAGQSCAEAGASAARVEGANESIGSDRRKSLECVDEGSLQDLI